MQIILQPTEVLDISFYVGPDELPRAISISFDEMNGVRVICDGIGVACDDALPVITVVDSDG